MPRTTLLVLLLLAGGVQGGEAEPGPLRLYTLDNFKPYTWCEDGEPRGIDVDIVQSALEAVGVAHEIHCRPWKRALEVSKQPGRGLFAAFRTPERELYLDYLATPLRYATYSLFMRVGDSREIRSVKDLYGLRIGINRGFSVSREFDLAVDLGFIGVETVTTTTQNLGKLVKGRLDGFVNNRLVTLCEAYRLGIADQIEEVTLLEHRKRPAYLALSNTNPSLGREALIARIDRQLVFLHDSGRVRVIEDKYADFATYCVDSAAITSD